MMRVELIREELDELIKAVANPEYMSTPAARDKFLAEWADACADLLYVVYGAAIAAGIDINPIFSAVHEANMNKASGPMREDGKKLKPPGWKHPNIAALLQEQMA